MPAMNEQNNLTKLEAAKRAFKELGEEERKHFASWLAYDIETWREVWKEAALRAVHTQAYSYFVDFSSTKEEKERDELMFVEFARWTKSSNVLEKLAEKAFRKFNRLKFEYNLCDTFPPAYLLVEMWEKEVELQGEQNENN